MSRNKNEKTGKKFSVSGLFENNKVIFVLSLVIAIICWAFVSMYETPETERLIQNVKVQLTGTNELNEEYGLSVFDNSEFTVDVTVRRLREKIEDDPSMPKYIITKRGVGYYFNK